MPEGDECSFGIVVILKIEPNPVNYIFVLEEKYQL